MNGNIQQIKTLLNDIQTQMPIDIKCQCAIFPPAIYLPLIESCLLKSSFLWGGQNVYPQNSGPFTGETSTPMLKDYHCRYVLVGHSERRIVFKEDEKIIAEKFHHVKEHGMIPVLCIGETLQEREQGLTNEVLARQLKSIVRDNISFKNCIIAYEPVWAIGTGRTASPEQAQDVHNYIRQWVHQNGSREVNDLQIIYGGSLNETNASSIFEMPDVDGGLIGGASLNAQQFVSIIKCIN